MLVTRFAPSPTGFLHIGHAVSAYAGFYRARRDGGKFLLRIEDIDVGRCRKEYELAIYEDLQWLGLPWDDVPLLQTSKRARHEHFFNELRNGNFLYPCFCSRKDIEAAQTAPHGDEGALYPGICRGLSPGEAIARIERGMKPAWRMDMAKAALKIGALSFTDERYGACVVIPEILGDVVVARKDGALSYHLCSVIDDHDQGVNFVVRGEDLLLSTHIHRVLQAIFGFAAPRYGHHPLMKDENGDRLSKRHQALTLRQLQDQGHSPESIICRCRDALGWP